MQIVERMRMAAETADHKVCFILTHSDAEDLARVMERTGNQPVPPGPVYSWHFDGVPVQPADVRLSYIIRGWDQPTIHFL